MRVAALYRRREVPRCAALDRRLGQGKLVEGSPTALPTAVALDRLRYRVDAGKAKDRHLLVGYDLTDTKEQSTLELRNMCCSSGPGCPMSPT